MITLNMVNEDKTVEKIEVSRETLELYFKQAVAIYEQANSAEQCIELIEQASTNDNVRSIIADMVVTIHKEREMRHMFMQMIKQALSGQ